MLSGCAMERTILIVVGYIGSGKSEVSGYISSLGIPMFKTGDVIRKAVIDSGQPLTVQNSEKMAVELRKKHGMDYPARKTGEKFSELKNNIICVEGLRDIFEIDHLATLGKVYLIVVKSPLDMRFKRSMSRKITKLEPSSRDTKNLEEFKWRDKSENDRGQREVTHTKKYPRFVINNNGTRNELYRKIDKILKTIKEGKAK
jgi:dephospho-CoA kinase